MRKYLAMLFMGVVFCQTGYSQNYRWEKLGGGLGDQSIFDAVNGLLNDTINNLLYAVGSYTVADDTINAGGLAMWDGSKWSTTLGYDTSGSGKPFIYSAALFNGEVYISTGHSVAKYNGSKWQIVGHFDDAVYTLCVYNNKLYAGGKFYYVEGKNIEFITCFNGSTWQPVAKGLDWKIASPAIVNAMTVWKDKLYVGGIFDYAFNKTGSIEVNSIACWNDTSWAPLGRGAHFGSSGAVTAYVYALAVHNDQLYVGGRMDTAGNIPVGRIAKWDGIQWDSLQGGLDGDVYSMISFNNQLCVGGDFTYSFKTWDDVKWFFLNSLEVGSEIYTMAIYNNSLFIGGAFITASGKTVKLIAKLVDVTSGNSLEPVDAFSIYPNPAGNKLIVSSKGLPAGAELSVSDLLGRMVLSHPINNSVPSAILDIQHLSPGVYLLSVKSREGLVVRKFIKE